MGELFMTQHVRRVLNVFCFVSSLKEDLKEETERKERTGFCADCPSQPYNLVTSPRAATDAGISDGLITTLLQCLFVVTLHLINVFWKFS